VREALQQPGTSHLVVTDCGYFPEAHSHGRVRTTPISQAVIIVCAKGGGWCETPAGRFPVTAGQVIILPPGHPHSYGSNEDTPWTLWWLHVTGRDLPEFLTAAGMTPDAPIRTPSDVYRVVALIAEVLQSMERDTTTASLLAAAGAAWHLMALLASDRSSVAELAAMSRLSGSHFAALFKSRIGYPALQYQTQLRMARARELLDTTDQSIAAVAAATGYPDSFYFARQFKKVHGVTPFGYRGQRKG
jgi:AraC family transcriptional regulator of arabinose operon